MTEHLTGRLTTLGFSILICLFSGTVYLYGIYSPQLMSQVGLSASDSATISFSSTIGSSIGGLPAGFLIDHFGPRLAIILASISVFLGYFAIYQIYIHKYKSVLVLSLAMIFVGMGSITAFYATLKSTQINFPKNRGTASTAPVGAYGMSATMFSIITAIWFLNNSGGLLQFLAYSCGLVILIGSFFIHIYLDHDDDEEEDQVKLTKFDGSPSTDTTPLVSRSPSFVEPNQFKGLKRNPSFFGSFSYWLGPRTESTSSNNNSEVEMGLEALRNERKYSLSNPFDRNNNAGIQITVTPKINVFDVIKRRLTDKVYLVHYLIVSLTSGIGQMYIYSIGFMVAAQYNYTYNDNPDKQSRNHMIAKVQALQVGVISIASFSGRVIGGLSSDFIVKKYNLQRSWIVLSTCVVLSFGQIVSIMNVNNTAVLTLGSIIVGGSYGLIFGTYPAIIADKYGTRTFSTTWGLICTGPIFTLLCLNKIFGYVYDDNSENGICLKANGCYRDVFKLSFALCYVALVLLGILMWCNKRK